MKKETELKKKCAKASPSEIPSLLKEVRTSPELICCVIEGLENRNSLEELGRSLHTSELLELLNDTLRYDNPNHWKLSPLLVGTPHEVFIETLLDAEEEQLEVFKKESISTPVQHHITLLAHDMRNRIEKLTQELNLLQSEIVSFPVEEISRKEISDLIAKMEDLGNKYFLLLEIINSALSIVWTTNRTDLIEIFTLEKEACQRILALNIGHSKKGNRKPTGLFLLLEEKLGGVYGNPLDNDDIEALSDDEPILEALVKLSVWYLRDYWEIGLLPNIRKPEDLELDPRKHSEAERQEFRERLFHIAKQNLDEIGLKQVQDLKKNMIFSKKILVRYIKEQTAKTAQ